MMQENTFEKHGEGQVLQVAGTAHHMRNSRSHEFVSHTR